jgi:hypothetical protein
MQLAGTALITVALLALTAGCGGEDAQPAEGTPASAPASAPAAKRRATLTPAGTEPFRVRGAGFKPRERVRVTIEPTNAMGGITRRVRATGRGMFVVSFGDILACQGVGGDAIGSRGSRAAFQFSSIRC